MKRRTKSTLKTIFIVILVLLIAVLGVGFAVLYVRNDGDVSNIIPSITDNTDNAKMTVKINDKEYESGSKLITIGQRKTLVVTVENSDKYDVVVIPRAGADFTFTVDGEVKQFSSLNELSRGFDIKVEGQTVSLTPYGGIVSTLTKALDKEIVLDRTSAEVSEAFENGLYTMVITDRRENGNNATILVYFEVTESGVDLITLNPSEVIF